MAPEVFKHRKYDKTVDVFSFAMILYQVIPVSIEVVTKDRKQSIDLDLLCFELCYRCLKETHHYRIMNLMKQQNMRQKGLGLIFEQKVTVLS